MSIYQYGQTPSTVPGVKVGIIPPQVNYLSPAETDILGIVGTASWGPVNQPVAVAGAADYVGKFGPLQARQYDAGTHVATATQQGSQNQCVVRVTDGTDLAASALLGVVTNTSAIAAGGTGYAINDTVTLSNGAVIKVLSLSTTAIATFSVLTQPTSEVTGTGAVTQVSTTGSGSGATFTFTYKQGFTATSKYTGSAANGDTVTLAPGNQTGTWKVTVFHPGLPQEVFNNIGAGLSGTPLWTAIVAAINNGTSLRAASQIIVATVGTSTSAPAAQTATLAGGTDGVTTITTAIMLGVDTTGARTGMYALRKTGASVGLLADLTDSTSWPTQVAFALSEGIYMIGVSPSGDTISNATSTKSSAGVDSYAFKEMFGDWCYWFDTTNGGVRLISPQGFVAGWIAANGPQNSSLNKELYGIVGTQRTLTNTPYQDDELALLEAAGIDVIINPSPGGPYFSAAFVHNSSSNPLIRGDNYTRLTNFIAATINAGLGP
jgi:hypothetical protein